mmetsp:Transcript_35833/g.74982  ORF Transcript_35833/g.74982 Transcript_35833/m.74982 type:complete len:113 (-) Transcript_35833:515-853(-)
MPWVSALFREAGPDAGGGGDDEEGEGGAGGEEDAAAGGGEVQGAARAGEDAAGSEDQVVEDVIGVPWQWRAIVKGHGAALSCCCAVQEAHAAARVAECGGARGEPATICAGK